SRLCADPERRPAPAHALAPDSQHGVPLSGNGRMIGRELRTPRPFPLGGIFWLLAAAALLVGGLGAPRPGGNVSVALAGLLPAAYSVALFLTRRPKFSARLTAEGIELPYARDFIPYEQIHEVIGPSTFEEGKNFAIRVVHARGYAIIPANINEPSRAVVEFLESQATPMAEAIDARDVSPALRDYLRRQDATFGPDKVWVYRPHLRTGTPRRGRLGRVLSIATLVAGGAWVIC